MGRPTAPGQGSVLGMPGGMMGGVPPMGTGGLLGNPMPGVLGAAAGASILGGPAGGLPLAAPMMAQPQEDLSLRRRIYVGSIAWDLTESDLRGVFAPYGTITRMGLMVCCVVRGCVHLWRVIASLRLRCVGGCYVSRGSSPSLYLSLYLSVYIHTHTYTHTHTLM